MLRFKRDTDIAGVVQQKPDREGRGLAGRWRGQGRAGAFSPQVTSFTAVALDALRPEGGVSLALRGLPGGRTRGCGEGRVQTSSVTAVRPPGSSALGHRKSGQAGYPGGKGDEVTSGSPARLLNVTGL